MPAAALYRPSSMGLLKLEPGFRIAVQPVLNDSHLVDRPPGGELEAKASEPGRAADGPSGPYSEPTWFEAFWSVESMVVMTFWPDSKARSDAIMSVIARTGSAPEPSSPPERTVPVAGPPAVPWNMLSPALRALPTAKTPTLSSGTLPSAPTVIGRPVGPRTALPTWSVSRPLAAAVNWPLRV